MQIAKEAGRIMRSDFKLGMLKRLKTDGSVLTSTDVKINRMILSEIKRELPSDDVFAEEGSRIRYNSNRMWVCDPIDGSIAFSHGVPTGAFSLGLTVNGRPVMGVVYDPFMDRMYTAERCKGAFLNDRSIRVSERSSLKNALVGMSFWKGAQFDFSPLYERLTGNDVRADVLMLGSIVYMGALVSCGEFTANFHPARYPHDTAALKVIIEEAGGKVTSLLGKEQRYDGGRIKGSIMSNGILHGELVELAKLIRKPAIKRS